MPYADPVKQREAQRRSRARLRKNPKWAEKQRARRRAQNQTEEGKAWNREAQRRWYARHHSPLVKRLQTATEAERRVALEMLLKPAKKKAQGKIRRKH